MASRIFDGPDPSGVDIPIHDLDEFYLVASWFRRRPELRAQTHPSIARVDSPSPAKKRRARVSPGTP